LFGGFNEGPVNTIMTYTCNSPKEEGTLVSNSQTLSKPDFFIYNGQYMEVPANL